MGRTPIALVAPRRAPASTTVEARRLAYVREHYATGQCSLAELERMVVQCLQGVQPCGPGGTPLFADPVLAPGGLPPAPPPDPPPALAVREVATPWRW